MRTALSIVGIISRIAVALLRVGLAYVACYLLLIPLFVACCVGVVVMAVCIGLWSAEDYLADYIKEQGLEPPNIPNLPW